MNKQQASPNWALIGTGILLVLAAAAFGVAFYYFDGVDVVADLVDQVRSGLAAEPSTETSAPPAPVEAADKLNLPAGMPDSFALRIWQEQVDSQYMIRRLVGGEVTELVITDVATEDDLSTLSIRVKLADGSSLPGQIVMRKFGDAWYVSTATAEERMDTASQTELPPLSEVDIPLLNTVISEQLESKSITQEYADGKVRSVELGKVEKGPNTVRIPAIMNEDHESGYADLVAVNQEVNGRDLWVIAKFGKTGSKPLKK